MKKKEWPQTLTLGELLDMYAERMALYANDSKACVEFANKYRNKNREEVDECIKDICKGKYPLHYILGLDTQQSRNAVVCMACILHSDSKDNSEFAHDLLSVYMKNTKAEKLTPIDEAGLNEICQGIEAIPDEDQSKYIVAYNVFAQHLINTPSRAFFPVYAKRYKNYDACYSAIYTNAYAAIRLSEDKDTTKKVNYMERYDYLYRTIVSQRFAVKNFGAVWQQDIESARKKTVNEGVKTDVLIVPILKALIGSGVLNIQRIEKSVLTKEMITSISMAAYIAANIDREAIPLEKVWEAIDSGKESTYDSATVDAANEKREDFKAALFSMTYYTLLCEQNKKAILEALNTYFFNPQGERLNAELKRCQRKIKADGEQLQQQKESLKEYKARTDAAEQVANDARNRYAAIQSKVEIQQRQIEELTQKLKALQEENDELRQQLPPQEDEKENSVMLPELVINYEEELSKILENKKVVFIGGNPNIMGKFAQKYPNAAVVERDKSMTADKQLEGACAVLFKTDYMGHKEYTPIKDLANRRNIPVGYIGDFTALNLVEKSVYEELSKLKLL